MVSLKLCDQGPCYAGFGSSDEECGDLAHLLFVEVPEKYAVVFTSTHHPLALRISCDEGRKETEVFIHMPCTATLMQLALPAGLQHCS